MQPANVISNEERDRLLASSPSADKITPDQMTARIADIGYHRLGETVTVCNILLDNGFSVRGESACVDPANYNADLGNKIAYDNAFRQLWPLFGFVLAEKRKLAGQYSPLPK